MTCWGGVNVVNGYGGIVFPKPYSVPPIVTYGAQTSNFGNRGTSLVLSAPPTSIGAGLYCNSLAGGGGANWVDTGISAYFMAVGLLN